MIYALIFCVALIRVFARALQQLSVVNYRWARVPLISYLMTFSDYFQWGVAAYFTAEHAWLTAVLVALIAGTGSWIGTYLAMWLHKETT